MRGAVKINDENSNKFDQCDESFIWEEYSIKLLKVDQAGFNPFKKAPLSLKSPSSLIHNNMR